MTEQEVADALQEMQDDPALITVSAFTTNSEAWPDNQMPFVQYHLNYLRTHKLARPQGYLSNLRIMLRIQ